MGNQRRTAPGLAADFVTAGPPVTISRREYEDLLERAEAAEDLGVRHVVERTSAALAAGDDVALPEAAWERIEAGESPVRVLREHRGLTQAQLAEAAQVTQAYVSALESKAKEPSLSVLRNLAAALAAPLGVLAS